MREGLTEKYCPKCGGNICLDEDQFGWYEYCLQCGYYYDLEKIPDLAEQVCLRQS